MQAEIIPFSSIVRKDVPSAHADAHLDGFTKALLVLKMFLKSSSSEIVCGVTHLLQAELLTADEAKALASFYGWELGQ